MVDQARARKLADRIAQIVAEMLERRIKDPPARLHPVPRPGSPATSARPPSSTPSTDQPRNGPPPRPRWPARPA